MLNKTMTNGLNHIQQLHLTKAQSFTTDIKPDLQQNLYYLRVQQIKTLDNQTQVFDSDQIYAVDLDTLNALQKNQ